MIKTIQLLYKLDLKLNKVATEAHQAIPLEDKILALNEAQLRLIKTKVSPTNELKAGMDSFKKRYHDLENLAVDGEEAVATKRDDKVYDTYEIDLTQLKQKFMFHLSSVGLCSREQCSGRPVFVERLIKHGDEYIFVTNPFWQPSFEYQATIGKISDNKLILYTDGTFSVDTVIVSYLRYPAHIDYEGYINFDGTPSTTVDCELKDYLEDELLEMAVLELGLDTENEVVIKTEQLRNKNNE
jgi:hypothetical protein